MSHRKSLLALGLGIGGYTMDHPKNGLGCLINWIASFRLGVRLWRELNDCFCRNRSTITHRTDPTHIRTNDLTIP